MLDIELFRKHPDIIKKSQKKRGLSEEVVDEVIKLDEKWREHLQKAEKLKHTRNEISEKINSLKKSGKSIQNEVKKIQVLVYELKKVDNLANNTKLV